MKNKMFSFVLVLVALLSVPCYAGGPLLDGNHLPHFRLPVPDDQGQTDYLRIGTGKNLFSLNEVGTPLVLVEIFNMYCTICQGEAPKVNRLYDLIKKSVLKDRLVVVGLGMGNSDFEVNVFKNKYNIRFPLFSDPDYELHTLFGKPRTPYFLLLEPKESDSPKIIFSHEGAFKQPETFLETLQQKAGIE